jgi:hypothetical protein
MRIFGTEQDIYRHKGTAFFFIPKSKCFCNSNAQKYQALEGHNPQVKSRVKPTQLKPQTESSFASRA